MKTLFSIRAPKVCAKAPKVWAKAPKVRAKAPKVRAYLVVATLFLTLWATNVHGVKSYGTLKVAKINSVYDGDTFRCDIEGIHSIIGQNIGIRVGGVDTPEMRDKRSRIKRLAVEARNTVAVILRTSDEIELRNIRRGKYFRIVADVYVDGRDLADILIEMGLGQPYDGGKKTKWK